MLRSSLSTASAWTRIDQNVNVYTIEARFVIAFDKGLSHTEYDLYILRIECIYFGIDLRNI